MAFEHCPVLLEAVLQALSPLGPDSLVVDVTLGLGGYSEKILQTFPSIQVIGLDQDSQALDLATKRLAPFGSRFRAVKGNFRQVVRLMNDEGISAVQGLVADLGVSNLQITEGERGFSFRLDGPLDMRMDPSSGRPAAHLVNTLDERALADLIYAYGEERLSRVIARALVAKRKEQPFTTTGRLAEVVAGCYPRALRHKGATHPARRTFQALRIAVNDELGALEELLSGLPVLLQRGGRAAVVSYHSLEDRAVKRAFRQFESDGLGRCEPRKRICPTEEEVEANPKARSAGLRVFVREDRSRDQGRQGPCRR